MKAEKIIEAIGITIMVICFIQHLLNRQGIHTQLSEYVEVLSMVALLIWSLAYSHRESKIKEK